MQIAFKKILEYKLLPAFYDVHYDGGVCTVHRMGANAA